MYAFVGVHPRSARLRRSEVRTRPAGAEARARGARRELQRPVPQSFPCDDIARPGHAARSAGAHRGAVAGLCGRPQQVGAGRGGAAGQREAPLSEPDLFRLHSATAPISRTMERSSCPRGSGRTRCGSRTPLESWPQAGGCGRARTCCPRRAGCGAKSTRAARAAGGEWPRLLGPARSGSCGGSAPARRRATCRFSMRATWQSLRSSARASWRRITASRPLPTRAARARCCAKCSSRSASAAARSMPQVARRSRRSCPRRRRTGSAAAAFR